MNYPMHRMAVKVAQFLVASVLCIALMAARSASAQTINVIASFSILGDIVQQVGGDRVRVQSLVAPNSDAHVFQPSPADAKKIAHASLVVVNGLGFEGWIDRLVKSSGYKGPVVTASAGIETFRHAHAHPSNDKYSARESHHHAHGDLDPHAWQDLKNVLLYVDNISLALSKVDPEGSTVYKANANRFKKDISALDENIRSMFAGIPPEQRKVVTTHEAFGYFGRAYGVKFISPVGISTEAEPSAKEIGRIIRQIRQEKISAVFIESISDPRLLDRIRQESGARIGGTLYSDSLSAPDGPASTYLKMMRHNATTLSNGIAHR
ncbi:metal ABC transporter substrate-binding protein [Propionivibrio limicola]|uniref:metal ABC transporter substrate-binding protein n=1 Tax=Propionivibrio limicola TaxID=167645 RepID=UPI0012925064|nr:metal ABC transporter substrate-binding protein [Propionivibrio limicola]